MYKKETTQLNVQQLKQHFQLILFRIKRNPKTNAEIYIEHSHYVVKVSGRAME